MVTLRNRKLRTGDGEKLGLTVDHSKLFDQLCWLWDYQALSRLPGVDLVSDSDFRFDHYGPSPLKVSTLRCTGALLHITSLTLG